MGGAGGWVELRLMYTSIAFVETLAAPVSSPVFAGPFKIGLGWSDAWVGLPFVVAVWVSLGIRWSPRKER